MSGITVRGTGSVSVPPDMATLVLGVGAQAATAGAAQSEASTRMNRVLETLLGHEIPAADITTRQVSLNATYDYRDSGPHLTGYQATQLVEVTARSLGEVGALIDACVEAGADQITEITLSVTHPEPAMARARTLAVEDARARAETLAAAGALRLGRAVAITEAPPHGGPGPLRLGKAEMRAAADTPVATGSTELSVEVEVVFEIAD